MVHHLFACRDEIQRIKSVNPDISHREAFSAAAKNVIYTFTKRFFLSPLFFTKIRAFFNFLILTFLWGPFDICELLCVCFFFGFFMSVGPLSTYSLWSHARPDCEEDKRSPAGLPIFPSTLKTLF